MDFQSIVAAHRDNADATLDTLTAMSDDDLASFQAAVLDRYREVYPDGTTASAEIAAELRTLAELMTAAKSAAATKQDVADAAAALAEQATALAEQAAEVAAEEDEPADDKPADEEPAPADVDAITASATQPAPDLDLGRLRSNGRPAATNPPGSDRDGRARTTFSISAAADVPGFAASSDITTIEDLTRAVMARCAGFPRGKTKSGRIQAGVAVISRDIDDDHKTTGNEQRDVELIDRVASEVNLPGGSLTAANGWCTPSEVDYSLCDSLTSQDGIWDAPTVEVNRGGLRYPSTWDYQSIAAMLPGQILCEPDLIAGTEKECIEAPCPDWKEFRLCAAPLCVTNDILQERAWPEGVQRFVQDVLDAQPHFINAHFLAQAEAAAIAETPMSGVSGVGHQLLDQLGLLVTFYRDLYRMALNSTLEVVLPHWLKQQMIADIAKRLNGNTEVAEAQIDDYFARRGTRVQWVHDWQPIAKPTTDGDGNVTFAAPSAWPATVTALIYPAGAFVKAMRNIITLDAIYDSVNLKKNKYTALFAEDEIGLMQRCYRASKVAIPLCVNGAMGPSVDICAVPTP